MTSGKGDWASISGGVHEKVWVFVIITLDFQDRRLIDSPSKRPLPDVDESNSGMELVKKPADDNSMDMDTA